MKSAKTSAIATVWVVLACCWSAGRACDAARATSQPASAPVARCTFEFALDKPAALASAGVYDPGGRLVRQLWAMKPLPAGKHTGAWDGQDQTGQPAPPGKYEFRVVLNGSAYRNVGTLGNTKHRPTVQTAVAAMAVDDHDALYFANTWEEAGQDFNKLDPDGRTVLAAEFRVRNGRPNGFPYSIALSGNHIFLGTITTEKVDAKRSLWGGHVVRRFRADTGQPDPFPKGDELGNIRFYKPGGETKFQEPLRSLAVIGDTLLVADFPANRVAKFDKASGAARGEFHVDKPVALAADARGRLWVAREGGSVALYDLAGKLLATPVSGAGQIGSIAFGPKGELYLADRTAGLVRIYAVRGDTATPARTFGQKAAPGDWAPDRFYDLRCAAPDSRGNLIVAHRPPTGGVILVKFAPDGKCLWRHMGLEFCTVGNYSPRSPDEFIDTNLNRLLLRDRDKGTWEYRGNMLDGEAGLIVWNHGVPRIVRLAETDFFYQAYGDGVIAFRRTGDALRPVAIAGGTNPRPDGKYNDRLPQDERTRWPMQWSWTDADANGRIDPAEVDMFKAGRGADVRYAMFGANVDAKGNILYCEHHTHGIWELPLSRLDERGNPVYDWSKARQIVAKDDTPMEFYPLMAVRADDGTMFAFGRSGFGPKGGLWKSPPNRGAWMGGWVLCRYGEDNRLLLRARLPQVCVGMDTIPGRLGGPCAGVMLGWYEKAVVYHYTPQGLLIGQMSVGDAADNNTGWMDNTSAVAVNRDGRDGLVDVFGEDSLNNRIIWYRVNDADIRTVTGSVELK